MIPDYFCKHRGVYTQRLDDLCPECRLLYRAQDFRTELFSVVEPASYLLMGAASIEESPATYPDWPDEIDLED